MWGKGNPQDNLESWQDILMFIAEIPDTRWGTKWKAMARELICGLQNHGLAADFRIGQSMHDIIISTAVRHGLRTEPRVTIEIDPDFKLARITYSASNSLFEEP